MINFLKQNNCNYAVLLGILVGLSILFFIKKMKFLNYILLENPRISLWQISHLILFFFLGKLCPNNYMKFLIFGIIWEVFEILYGYITGDLLYWTSNGVCGQVTDVIMNMLGYYLAHVI